MNLTEKKQEGIVVIELEGRLDTANYEEVEKKLWSMIEKGEKFFLLDMKGLSYISSSGLRVLLKSLKKLRGEDGNLVLAGLNNILQDVFEISGFSKFFDIFSTTEEAIKSFK